MNDSMADKPTRREFFRSVGRWAGAGALAALGAVLIGTGRQRRAEHTCTGDGLCRYCERLNDCVLPQAQSTRRATGIGDRNVAR